MVQGIPESAPIDDGQPDAGGGWPGSGGREERREDRRLLKGADEVRLSPPGVGAMGIVQGCVLGGIGEALEVPRPRHGHTRAWEQSPDPIVRAEQICSEAGSMLQTALAAGRVDVGSALENGARAGMERAMEVLRRLGFLDGPSGEAVAQMIEAWAAQLCRLVGSVEAEAE